MEKSRIYNPRNLFLRFNANTDLFGEKNEKYDRCFKIRVVVGEFYETLAQAFFRGKRNTRKNIGEVIVGTECEPDIENHKEETFIEVKASKFNNYFKLFDHQLKKYQGLLLNQFPFDSPRVNYAFFIYNIREVQRECPDYKSLIDSLSKKTLSLLVLPFGIVESVCSKSNYYNQGEKGPYKPFHYFNASKAKLFFKNPKEAMRFYGINPDSISIEERLFPSNWTINDNKITPFDVMQLSYKDYQKWLDIFKEQNLKDELPF